MMNERIESLKAALRQVETQDELDCVMATFPASAMTPAEGEEIATFLRARGAELAEHAEELRRYLRERKAREHGVS